MTQLFQEPAPTFSDPLGMLQACHARMLGFCDTLLKLPDHLAVHGADEDARQAARQIHHYFSTAAKLHHEDEEENVFPLLVRVSLKIAETIHRLRQDHTRMEQTWQALAPLLARPEAIPDPEAFRTLCEALADLYRQHIRVENEFIRDKAQHLLSAAQLQEIGRAMAKRRGVTAP